MIEDLLRPDDSRNRSLGALGGSGGALGNFVSLEQLI